MKGNKIILVRIAVLILAVVCLAACREQDKKAAVTYQATITATVDGDTVKVRFAGTPPPNCAGDEIVRLIGVDTPELFSDPPQFYAQEARDYTDLYWQQDVMLEFDKVSTLRDRYGRLLAYIYVDGTLVPLNLLLIGEGYGRYYDKFDFESDRMAEFSLVETKARDEKRGLWQKE